MHMLETNVRFAPITLTFTGTCSLYAGNDWRMQAVSPSAERVSSGSSEGAGAWEAHPPSADGERCTLTRGRTHLEERFQHKSEQDTCVVEKDQRILPIG